MEAKVIGSLRLVESPTFRRSEKSFMVRKAQQDSRVRAIEIRKVGKGKSVLVLVYDVESGHYV